MKPLRDAFIGSSELLSACEDCVQEIRFHHDALQKSLERKQVLTARLHDLVENFLERLAGSSPLPETQVQAQHQESVEAPRPRQRNRRSTDRATGGSTPDLPSIEGIRLEQPGIAGAPATSSSSDPPAQLSVFCFGQCQVLQDGAAIEGWPQSKSKSLFKYLVLNRRQPVAKEVLMQIFWPDADAEAARNNLNVSIYGARKILARLQPALTHIVLQDGCYGIGPDMRLWVDVEHFVERVQAGRDHDRSGRTEDALAAYLEADQTYRGDLLVEERGDEWVVPERTRLRELAMDTLRRLCHLSDAKGDLHTCIAACRRILEIDHCDEAAHRELMQYYSRLGQPHLALRQFQSCADALSRELSMIPSPATTALYRRIQRREVAPSP